MLSVALWGRLGGDGQIVLYTGQRYSFGHEGEFFSLNHLQHLVLPVLTLALVNVAVWSRFQRAAMIEALRSDYVHRRPRARALRAPRVIGHALRNALAPIVTLVALDLGALFAGAVVTETVFSWPGMGRLLRDAALDARHQRGDGDRDDRGGRGRRRQPGSPTSLYAALDPRVELGTGPSEARPAAPGARFLRHGPGMVGPDPPGRSSCWRAGSGPLLSPYGVDEQDLRRASPGTVAAPPVRHRGASGRTC